MIPLMFFSAHALFGDRSGELYTITWLVDGVAYEDDYASGELPEPPAGIVADFADEQYVYTFDYWLCEDDGERGIKPVTQSTTYSAVFKVKETRKYTVTWCNWDGSVLNVDEVEYGKIPEYMHEEPIKPSENRDRLCPGRLVSDADDGTGQSDLYRRFFRGNGRRLARD